ncbi:MAG TPA: SIMPL domain-containing protein [Pirellulales bacterium]|nr:SIMPL domain-containing protein [Pirellulales bacterium]
MNTKSKILIALSLSACAAMTASLVAAEPGITVSGTGEVLAQPTHVEIDLNASAAAELTGDAIQKYRDSLRRTTEAFKKLDMKGLKIEERELSFANSTPGGGNAMVMMAVPGGGAPAAKPQVDITRSLRLVLAGIDKIEEAALMETIGTLLDTARDSGATVGQSSATNALLMQMMGRQATSTSMVTFVVDNASQQHEKAYQQAFAEAKSRATRLASLAGATLGKVVSIEEGVEAKDDASIQEQMVTAIYGIGGAKSKGGIRLTSDKYGDIPVRVTLRVRFALGDTDSSDKKGGAK